MLSPKISCSTPSHADREGSMYCSKCDKYYCFECESGVHSTNFSDHAEFTHDIGSYETIFSEKCEKHKGYSLDYSCQDHHCLCCAKCVEKGGDHANCNYFSFDSLDSNWLKENFMATLNNLEVKVTNSENFTGEELEKKMRDMEENAIKIKEKISKTFRVLHETLDKREAELLQEVERIYGNEDFNSIIAKFKDVDRAKILLKEGEKFSVNKKHNKENLCKIAEMFVTFRELNELETIISDALIEKENIDFSTPCDTLIKEIKSFGKIVHTKTKFVPGITVNSTTHNSISASCKRAPFDKVLYQVGMINSGNGDTEIVDTGETPNFELKDLKPNTEYILCTRIAIEGLYGNFSEPITVKTNKEPINTVNNQQKQRRTTYHIIDDCYQDLFRSCFWRADEFGLNRRRYVIEHNHPGVAKSVSVHMCLLLGNRPIPLNRVISWNIKILNSMNNDGNGIYIGVAPYSANTFAEEDYLSSGWFINCYDGTLISGPPHDYNGFKKYGPIKEEGEYVHIGDSVGVVMDTIKGTLSFVLNGVNRGAAYEDIPLEEPLDGFDTLLTPCVILVFKDDSVEIDPIMKKTETNKSVPVPKNFRISNKTWDSLTISWSSVTKATSYDIEVDGTIFKAHHTKTSFTKGGLLQESSHSVRIRTVSTNGVSRWSNYIRIKTPQIPPFSDCVWKMCPLHIDDKLKYTLDEGNPRIAKKDKTGNYDRYLCTITGSTSIPQGKVTSWNVKILESHDNGSEIYVGVAPFSIDQSNKNNREECGWYFSCYNSQLLTGHPYTCNKKTYGPRWRKGEYVRTGETVGVIADMINGKLSFIVNGVNFGIAFEGIPLDKPLVPCVLLKHKDDSVELDLSEATENVNRDIPVPQWGRSESIGWDSIRLSWKLVEGETMYQIRESSSTDIETLTVDKFVKRELLPNKDYKFNVRVIRGNEVGTWSPYAIRKTKSIQTRFTDGWKKCPRNVSEEIKYLVGDKNPMIATKVYESSSTFCTIIGATSLPKNDIVSWDVKILKSKDNYGSGIMIGVAPYDINQNDPYNMDKCGWYFVCLSSCLASGPQANVLGKSYCTFKEQGNCVHIGDVITPVINTKIGELSFIINGVNYGVAVRKIPLNKPLVPCVLLCHRGDTVELLA